MTACVVAIALLSTACQTPGAGGFSVPVKPSVGVLFAHQLAPLQTDFDNTSFGKKTGSAEVRYLRDSIITGLPLASWGSASIEDAARDGGITNVRHADYELLSVLGIYVELKTVVYGD